MGTSRITMKTGQKRLWTIENMHEMRISIFQEDQFFLLSPTCHVDSANNTSL